MQNFLIGENLNGCAFVVGSLSFLDKISCGIALYVLQSNQSKFLKFLSYWTLYVYCFVNSIVTNHIIFLIIIYCSNHQCRSLSAAPGNNPIPLFSYKGWFGSCSCILCSSWGCSNLHHGFPQSFKVFDGTTISLAVSLIIIILLSLTYKGKWLYHTWRNFSCSDPLENSSSK